jgi:hypothetical protein
MVEATNGSACLTLPSVCQAANAIPANGANMTGQAPSTTRFRACPAVGGSSSERRIESIVPPQGAGVRERLLSRFGGPLLRHSELNRSSHAGRFHGSLRRSAATSRLDWGRGRSWCRVIATCRSAEYGLGLHSALRLRRALPSPAPWASGQAVSSTGRGRPARMSSLSTVSSTKSSTGSASSSSTAISSWMTAGSTSRPWTRRIHVARPRASAPVFTGAPCDYRRAAAFMDELADKAAGNVQMEPHDRGRDSIAWETRTPAHLRRASEAGAPGRSHRGSRSRPP